MPSQVTNYQCPSCTGPLQFSAATGNLECEYCGSAFTVSQVEEYYAGENRKAREAAAQAEESRRASDSGWGAEAEHMRSYLCPSCGAELLCDETTAATSCPYCGNPSVVPGQFRGTKRPDHVIPFGIRREQAVEALKRHYKGKLLLPGAFAKENHLQEIKGVYVPFWLYSGKADVSASFEMTRSHTHTTPNERIVTTEHYRAERAGTVAFEGVPVDGSSKMPDALMDAIEPFDYSGMKPFALGYLPGFLADKYDVDEQACAARAEERCRNSAVQAMEESVTGYETCRCVHSSVELQREKVEYALLPVWLLSTRWKDKNYLFAMNGQTGRFVGDLPISAGKTAAWFAGLFLLFALLGSMFFEPEGAILGGAVIAAVICAVMASMMKTARVQTHAHAYIPAVGVTIRVRQDRFLRRSVVRHRINHDGPGNGNRPGGPQGRGPR